MTTTVNLIDYPDGSHAAGTAPLWQGRLTWTNNEDSMESIDVDPLPIYGDESVVLVARNGSPTVDMTVNVGHLVYGFPTGATTETTWVCTEAATATDIITCVAHGLKHGDAVTPVESARGLTAGTVYYVVGANAATDVTADTFALAAARGSASLANITGDDDEVPVTLQLVAEFAEYTSFTVPKFAAGSSTAPIAGFASRNIGSFGRYGGQIQVEKSAATAGVCTCYLAIYRG
jgi:hypothetical protein